MNGLQQSLTQSPELFPLAADPSGDNVSFIRLTRGDYARASFLDTRILTPQMASKAIAWSQVAGSLATAPLKEHCAFIFHIGHVGSTLLSRLIGAHPGVFALREPMILRSFAQAFSEPQTQPPGWRGAEFEARLGDILRLLSRTFEAQQLAVIKATSFVSELAGALLSRSSAPKALIMYVSPESYIATILGGPNSRQEARMLTPSRLQRLHRRIGEQAWRAASLSEGETLALGWACEMTALAGAAGTAGTRIHWLNFDRFLLDPSLLLHVFQHFQIDAGADQVRAILEGPDMSRYSKAPEYAYDRALRESVLNEARAMHAVEIKRGLAWLERAASRFSPVRQALALV